MVDVLVMVAMFAAPHQDGILEGGRAENQGEQPHRPFGLKGNVREKAVVTQANAKAAGEKQDEEKRNLEPVEAEVPEIKRNGGESEKQSSAEERTGDPVDAIGR